MAWTAPMTAVANAVFTAAQFNTNVRDNLLETAPAKATVDGSIFVGTAANAIAERIPAVAEVLTSETTSDTAYTDLATAGPAVTVTTGTTALVIIATRMANDDTVDSTFCSYAISGATTRAADDDSAIFYTAPGAINKSIRMGCAELATGLTAGSNTFTMKYRVAGTTTATYINRRITVVPL